MKKFDLICDRYVTGAKLTTGDNNISREYLIPSRATANYNDDFNSQTPRLANKSNFTNRGYDYDSDDLEEIEDLSRHQYRKQLAKVGNQNNVSSVEFYYDFGGFLPESLYHRIITRAARWTLMKNGVNVKSGVRMYYRKTRFYLDDLHDFIIEMAPLKYALLKVITCILFIK